MGHLVFIIFMIFFSSCSRGDLRIAGNLWVLACIVFFVAIVVIGFLISAFESPRKKPVEKLEEEKDI